MNERSSLVRRPVRGLTIAAAVLISTAAAGESPHLLPGMSARAQEWSSERSAMIPDDATLEAQGARIGHVRFNTLELFDIGGRDEDSLLFRLGNRLHFTTHDSTIADQLLFREGDLYRASAVAESARILRSQRYLRDASIRPVAYEDGFVELEVTTQDVWSFNPGFSFGRKGGKNSTGFELEELNLLGSGTHLGIGFKSDVERESRIVTYRDRQLGSSWWDLLAGYSDNSDGRLADFALIRPFYSLDSRWSAGVEMHDDLRVESRYDLGERADQYQAHTRFANAQWGFSKGLVDGWARRYSFGVTYDEHSFADAPGAVASAALPQYRKLVYPWIAAEWTQDRFATTRNRDQIGRTEDYSLGWNLRARLGHASPGTGSDRTAFMLGAAASTGYELSPRQSLMLSADASGRLEDGDIANGILVAEARYYFRQTPRRLFFASLSATAGSRLDTDLQITLGGDNGLRGYPLRYQAGEGRWVFTAEQRMFSNWFPFQLFNVGGAVFFDMGEAFGRDPLASEPLGLLKDVGFGLRFGNGRSALGNVLHVDFAVPLDGDASIRNLQILVETKARF
jgi:outer membrane protein assembly factor BamA